MGNVLAGAAYYLIYVPFIWFYGMWDGFLWKCVAYVGIPLYIFGMLLGIAFSGGYFLLIIAGIALYYMYIKKLLFNVNPIDAPKQNNG